MALFTASVTGDWNDGATWGNTSPGTEGIHFPDEDGTDTFVINAGVTVTIPDGYDLAFSSGTVNGSLTVGEVGGTSGTLKLSGTLNFVSAATAFTMNDGGTIDDNGNAIILSSDTGGDSSITVSLVGTAANRVTIMSSSTVGDFYTSFPDTLSGSVTLDNIDMSGIDSYGILPELLATTNYSLTNATLTGHRIQFHLGTINLAGSFNINGFTAKDATGVSSPSWDIGTTVFGTNSGSHAIANLVLDNADTTRNLGLTDTHMPGGFNGLLVHDSVFQQTSSGSASITDWLVTNVGGNGQEDLEYFNWTDGYYYSDISNPHVFAVGNADITDSVLELVAQGDGGDAVSFNPGASQTGTSNILRNILLWGIDGSSINVLTNGTTGTINFDHNTVVVNGVAANSPSDNFPLMVKSQTSGTYGGTVNTRSNINYFVSGITAPTDAAGIKLEVATADQIDNTDYNAFYPTFSDRYVNVVITGKTEGVTAGFGASDIGDNPNFVDDTRTLAAWDTSLGGAGTAANAIAELLKLNDASGFDTNYTVANAIAYIQAGFTPTNIAYDGTAHDGGDIGAVAYAASSTISHNRVSLELGIGL